MQHNVANVRRRVVRRRGKERHSGFGRLVGKRHARMRRESRNPVQHRVQRVGASVSVRIPHSQGERLILNDGRVAARDGAGFLVNEVALVVVFVGGYQKVDGVMSDGLPLERQRPRVIHEAAVLNLVQNVGAARENFVGVAPSCNPKPFGYDAHGGAGSRFHRLKRVGRIHHESGQVVQPEVGGVGVRVVVVLKRQRQMPNVDFANEVNVERGVHVNVVAVLAVRNVLSVQQRPVQLIVAAHQPRKLHVHCGVD